MIKISKHELAKKLEIELPFPKRRASLTQEYQDLFEVLMKTEQQQYFQVLAKHQKHLVNILVKFTL